MNSYFTFKTKNASGHAYRGRIEFSAGSLSNRAQLYLDSNSSGEIRTLDDIEIEITSFDPVSNASFSFPAFKGVVSQLAPRGDYIALEAVTVGSYLLVTPAKPTAWSNVSLRVVFMALLSASKVSAASVRLPDGFGTQFLHVWETCGGSLSDEILALFASHLPGTMAFASFLGEIFVGDRDQLGELLQFWPFPSDAAGSPVGRGVVDPDASTFSLRPACPHQVAYETDATSFLGTIDSVVHEIRPGRAETSVVLDRRPSPILAAALARAA